MPAGLGKFPASLRALVFLGSMLYLCDNQTPSIFAIIRPQAICKHMLLIMVLKVLKTVVCHVGAGLPKHLKHECGHPGRLRRNVPQRSLDLKRSKP